MIEEGFVKMIESTQGVRLHKFISKRNIRVKKFVMFELTVFLT